MARTKESAVSLVAKETLAYCTSCKMDLNHIVVSMKGDRIGKVQCLTCKKEHAYKVAKGVTEPPKKKKKKESAAASSATSIEAEWAKLMGQHKDVPFKSYAPKGNFTLGDKLRHATFGEGIVSRLIYPNKIEVLFQADMKILIHGGQK